MIGAFSNVEVNVALSGVLSLIHAVAERPTAVYSSPSFMLLDGSRSSKTIGRTNAILGKITEQQYVIATTIQIFVVIILDSIKMGF